MEIQISEINIITLLIVIIVGVIGILSLYLRYDQITTACVSGLLGYMGRYFYDKATNNQENTITCGDELQ